MNIGIITFSGHLNNFGASMQSLALRRKLIGMGHDAYHLINRAGLPVPSDAKEWETLKFNKRQLKYIIKDQADELNRLDVLLYGSDQIWSQSLTKLNPFYFGALPAAMKQVDIPRISYAASLGATTNLDEKEVEDFYRENLKRFSHISLREERLKSKIEELSGKPVSIVLDPTLLLDRCSYFDMTTRHNPYGDDYIYCHLHAHNGRDDKLADYARKLSSLLSLPIVHNLKDVQFDNQLGTTREMAPDGVLNAIFHSSYVITQSFHVTAFALIFGKPFLALGHGYGLDIRVEGLLTKLGIHEKFVDRSLHQFSIHAAFKEIDYSDVYIRLEELKQHSIDYLSNSLNSVKKPIKSADYFSTGNEFYCYGCGSCVDKCPINALELKKSEEGFWFPAIMNNCNKCGLCSNTCPHNVKPKSSNHEYAPKAYLAFSNDDEIHRNSSSGGMFMTFAKEILKKGGYVIGVKTADVIRAMYDIADTEEGAKAFRYSKYVEPEHNDIYNKTLKALKTSKPVLFTGTPCKIAGLMTFLGKSYDNLYTIEILCKGYPSALALKKYVQFKERGRKSKITYFQFRSNQAPAKQAVTEMHFANGRVELGWKNKHSYMRAFSGNWALRKSCYSCEFKKNNYVADIIMGDAWGLEEFYHKEVPEGLSCLKINTLKGEALYEAVKGTIFSSEVTVEEMYKKNINKPVAWKPLRSEFYSALEKENIQQVVERFVELEKLK